MFKIGSVPEQLSSYALAAIGMKEVPGGLRSSTGGLPPEGLKFEWPQFDGQSLSFLAIIYLDELPMLHDWLPRDGVLLFFYDFENGPTGDDLAESPGWKVIWVTDISGCDGVVCERPENLKDGFVFKARPLSFEAGETLPFLMDHPLIQEVERPDELIEELEELEAELEEEEGGPSSGQIGGYSGAADGALYAFRCREQIMGEDPMLAYDATLEDIQAAEKEMFLLFEFEMEEREAEEAPEIFGTRNFSFWAFKADVRNQDFSKVWLQVEVD
ncbi:MAG: hypothetical protein ACJAQT_001584 [Akkermansiaceae bacterium]|jgi:uncharacterized protein YwqG